MYIKNGIAYAGEPQRPIKVSGVRPLDGYKLWVRFTNGEAKVIDFSNAETSTKISVYGKHQRTWGVNTRSFSPKIKKKRLFATTPKNSEPPTCLIW